MDACDVAKDYILLTEQGKYEQVGTLFASDAEFMTPKGTILKGSAAITAFYSAFLPTIKPVNRIHSLVREGTVCVMQIQTRLKKTPQGTWAPAPDGEFAHTAIDVMTVDSEGKIKKMMVYLAPQNFWIQ
jgi:hypothetical protein